ncbi:MAG TPA: hypothetical protein VD996_03245 [Chitinophagaceae bacterium]|nr:hypothetical protein [Chitinophagaceae bacterium]
MKRYLVGIIAGCLLVLSSCKKSNDDAPATDGINIEFDGRTHHFTDDEVIAEVHNGVIGLSWLKGNTSGSLIVETTATGTFQWNDNQNQFAFTEPEGYAEQHFSSYHDDGLSVSGGSITITKVENAGGVIEGSFVVEPAGKYRTSAGGEYLGTTRITGSFRVKHDQ